MSKVALVFLIILVFSTGFGIGNFYSTVKPSISPSPSFSSKASVPGGDLAGVGREKASVSRVIDGDTIELTDRRKVRYIGIDTPESVDPRQPVACFGKEATEKNREFVLGKEIEMEKDVSETDRFGRLLRYVYVKIGETEMMVNEGLVREGYAHAASYPPDVKHQEKLRAAEVEAREVERGLWQSCKTESVAPAPKAGPETQEIGSDTSRSDSSGCTIKGNISSTGDKIYHLPGCGSYEKTSIDPERNESWFCSEEEAVSAGWRKAKNC